MSWQSAPVLIPAGHPSAPLHFPGRPVVPGALLLDAVMRLLGTEGVIFRAVKFLRPVAHGQALDLRWQPAPGGTRFEMRCHEVPVLTGTLAPA